MIFSPRTYRAAISRSIKAECLHFSEHARAFRGPQAWIKQMQHTDAIIQRRIRERS